MTDTDSAGIEAEPPRIRALRRLVTLLTLTLTFGMIIVVGLLVWRLTTAPAVPPLPGQIALPAGERLTGYAQNPDWIVLITEDDHGTQRLHLVVTGTTEIHQTAVVDPR